MDNLQIPIDNIEIYKIIYVIEVSMREFIVEALNELGDPLWYIRRVPMDPMNKMKSSIHDERKAKWMQHVFLHPIYYVDFPHLKEIITRKDNWNDAFKKTFLRNENITYLLSTLEPIRNKIAHNRCATKADLEIAKAVYVQLCSYMGDRKLCEYSSRCTSANDIYGKIFALRTEAEKCYNLCITYNIIEDLSIWESIFSQWWFKSEYLDTSISEISNFFSKIQEYRSLPRDRGAGHIMESWVRDCDINSQHLKADSEFIEILKMGENSNGFFEVSQSL